MIASIWDVVRCELGRLEAQGKDDHRDSWMGNAIKAVNRLEEHCNKHGAYATPPEERANEWRDITEKPQRVGLYIVTDEDGQLGFAHYERNGKWNHVPDANLGELDGWHPLPQARRSPLLAKEKP